MKKDPGFIKEVRKKPYSIILFDEIEKAHPDIINILLQILEDGRLTDNSGRVTNFKNAVIIMTSNIGWKIITNNRSLGFNTKENNSAKRDVLKEAKENFSPEFLNRIDEIVVFQKLDKDELKQIANRELEKIAKRMKNKDIKIIFDESISDYVVNNIDDDTLGARPIRRIIQDYIQDKLVNEYLDENIKDGDLVNVFEINNEIFIRRENKFANSEINKYLYLNSKYDNRKVL